jgi:ribonucleoside-diphosphate reductase alpha chain
MKRVKADENWSLFCPSDCPDLIDLYGDAFEARYIEYEKNGKQRQVVKARTIWQAVLKSQSETGTPYILYKDACNKKSNQKNLGTIRSSNLCCEIIQYSASDETAVCNLASIALPRFVSDGNFNHQKLIDVVAVIVRNLNKIIDINYYPTECAKKSNMLHRPIGIGVQGLADVFAILDIAFDSPEARQLNKDIFETIYYSACYESNLLATKQGSYDSFRGSPIQQGIFQFDLWGVVPSKRYDWVELRKKIVLNGMRNSLLTALMPTASTAQILGNSECFEPYTSMLYVRRTLSGEFVYVNKYLITKLKALNLWNVEMKDEIIANKGSIQNIGSIPQHTKNVFRTVWEISQKSIIEMSADRSPYIDQSQSMNIFISKPTSAKLNAMHFYGWEKGLKTGMYYLRSNSAADAIQFSQSAKRAKVAVDPEAVASCSRENAGECLACSS